MPRLALHELDAQVDVPDARDRVYQPPLIQLKRRLDARDQKWWSDGRIRNQWREPSCTGHALAATVDHLLAMDRHENPARGITPSPKDLERPYASALMLYGNAQLHDEWDGEGYSGSSLRGAIKGFHHNGLCSIDAAHHCMTLRYFDQLPQVGDDRKAPGAWRWHTNRDIVKDARNIILGAYYRVSPRLVDMHAALCDTRVLVVAARVHPGWMEPADGVIPFQDGDKTRATGTHAFCIIGYTEQGFLVQNSWGRDWADGGVAVWTYADWAQNVCDVWTLRLAAPFPDSFDHTIGVQGAGAFADGGGRNTIPNRLDVLGHFLPMEDGRLLQHGRYHHDDRTLRETFAIIKSRRAKDAGGDDMARDADRTRPENLRYKHVLFHLLGGTRTEFEAARVAKTLHPVYRANGIYPLFLNWEAEMFGELRRSIRRIADRVAERSGPEARRSHLGHLLMEIRATGLPIRIRRELERSIRRFFYFHDARLADGAEAHESPGLNLLMAMFADLENRHRKGSISYHIVAHDLGARFAMEFLESFEAFYDARHPVISSLHLVSPMLDIDRFMTRIAPYLSLASDGAVNRRARLSRPIVERAMLWTLTEEQNSQDRFDLRYPRSWPDFWSRVLAAAPTATGEVPRPLDIPETGAAMVKLLALDRYAAHLNQVAGDQGLALEHRHLAGGRPSPVARHDVMDAAPEFVNRVMADILCAPPDVQATDNDWRDMT